REAGDPPLPRGHGPADPLPVPGPGRALRRRRRRAVVRRSDRGRAVPSPALPARLRRREVTDLHGDPRQAPGGETRRRGGGGGTLRRRRTPVRGRRRLRGEPGPGPRVEEDDEGGPQGQDRPGRLTAPPAVLSSARRDGVRYPLTREPAEEDGDGPGVVTQFVAGTADHLELGPAVGRSDRPAVL